MKNGIFTGKFNTQGSKVIKVFLSLKQEPVFLQLYFQHSGFKLSL